MAGYNYTYNQDQSDADALERQMKLVQALAQPKPTANNNKFGRLADLASVLIGQYQMKGLDDQQKALASRAEQRRTGEMENMFNFATMKPQAATPGFSVPDAGPGDNVDTSSMVQGNPGESPDAFQARKLALAKSMITSPNPQVAQFAMAQMMPQKKDYMTVKDGESVIDPTIIGADGKPRTIWAGTPKAPEGFRLNTATGELEVIPGYAEGKGKIAAADKLPKMGEIRTRISGSQEFQDEWSGKAWVPIGSGQRWQPQQPGQPQLVPDGKGGMAWLSPPARGQSGAATLPGGAVVPDVNSRRGETDLRREFEGLPEVKSYKLAFPAFASVKDAASRNTPQADINLVYGIAKIFDPTSVVREGEYATVANSPNIPDRIKGVIQYVSGGGKLSPEAKAKFVAEAESRVKSYEAEVNKAKNSYGGIVKQYGYNPDNVFQGMGNMGKPGNGQWSITKVE